MRRFIVVLAALTVASSMGVVPPAAADPVAYVPPVEAPLTDRFRPPATDFGPGNRGVDYATAEGQVVTAAASGEVTFAGPVGNDRHVVVLHEDGIRTHGVNSTSPDHSPVTLSVRQGAGTPE